MHNFYPFYRISKNPEAADSTAHPILDDLPIYLRHASMHMNLYKSFAFLLTCGAFLSGPSALAQPYVIDDFEDGQPFSLTTNEADGQLTSSSSANVPGGVRYMSMRPSEDLQRQGTADLSFTSGDNALVLNAYNPPNSGFIIGSLNYGNAIPGQAELNLDLSDLGDQLYIDIVQGTLETQRWSGFYIVLSVDGIIPHFPDGTGTQNFLVLRGHGRHKVPFSYFGENFDPTDIDSFRFSFWSVEGRVSTPPLRILEIGVVPEPGGLMLALVTLTGSCFTRRR